MPCPAPHRRNGQIVPHSPARLNTTPLRQAARAGAAADGHGAGAMAGEQWDYGARALRVRVLHCLALPPMYCLLPLSFDICFHLCLPRYLHLHLHFPPSLSTSCMPCVYLNLICFQGVWLLCRFGSFKLDGMQEQDIVPRRSPLCSHDTAFSVWSQTVCSTGLLYHSRRSIPHRIA
jgi:hypothetical protein